MVGGLRCFGFGLIGFGFSFWLLFGCLGCVVLCACGCDCGICIWYWWIWRCGVTVAFGAFFGGVLLIRLVVGLDDLPFNACLIDGACLVGLLIAVTANAMCLIVNNVGVWFFIFFLV